MPRKIPAGETISRVEAPRGELFYFIKSNGGEKPERVKVRTPSLCNLASVMATASGHQLADMPMILAGIDPCFSCNDRMVIVHAADGNAQPLTWEDFAVRIMRTSHEHMDFQSYCTAVLPRRAVPAWSAVWLYEWVDRKLVARFQNRIGPRWFQPLADMVKLLAQRRDRPERRRSAAVHRPADRGAGRRADGGAVRAAGRACARASAFAGDLIVTLYLLSLLTLCLGLAGANTADRFSLIGATRTLTQLFSYEAPFLLALLGPAIVAGSWQISEINAYAGTALDASHPADRLRGGAGRPDGQAGTAALRRARSRNRNRGRRADRIQRARAGAVPAGKGGRAGDRPDADGGLLPGRPRQPARFLAQDAGLLLVLAGLQSLFCPPAHRPDGRAVVALSARCWCWCSCWLIVAAERRSAMKFGAMFGDICARSSSGR